MLDGRGGVLPAVLPKLADDAWLYIEAPHDAQAAPPGDWLLHREGRTREVRYALYRRRRAGATDTLDTDPAGDPAAPN